MAKIVLIMEQLHTKNSERFSGKNDPDYYVAGGFDPVPTPPEESNKPSKRSFWAILVNVLLAIWQAPQNLVGLIVACFTGWGYQGIIGGVMFFTKNGTGCVSLDSSFSLLIAASCTNPLYAPTSGVTPARAVC